MCIRDRDNPDFINGITEIYKKENPKAAEDPKFKNMFRNASLCFHLPWQLGSLSGPGHRNCRAVTNLRDVYKRQDVLFAEETKPGLEVFEKGQVTELGAVNVMTGIYTGRSPKDKFFVMNEASKDSVCKWWRFFFVLFPSRI